MTRSFHPPPGWPPAPPDWTAPPGWQLPPHTSPSRQPTRSSALRTPRPRQPQDNPLSGHDDWIQKHRPVGSAGEPGLRRVRRRRRHPRAHRRHCRAVLLGGLGAILVGAVTIIRPSWTGLRSRRVAGGIVAAGLAAAIGGTAFPPPVDQASRPATTRPGSATAAPSRAAGATTAPSTPTRTDRRRRRPRHDPRPKPSPRLGPRSRSLTNST